MTAFAKDNGFKKIRVYADDGYSTSCPCRPMYNQLIDDIVKGLVSYVIVTDVTRLGNYRMYSGQYAEIVFPSIPVRIIILHGGTVSIDEDEGFLSAEKAGDDLKKELFYQSICMQCKKTQKIKKYRRL